MAGGRARQSKTKEVLSQVSHQKNDCNNRRRNSGDGRAESVSKAQTGPLALARDGGAPGTNDKHAAQWVETGTFGVVEGSTSM